MKKILILIIAMLPLQAFALNPAQKEAEIVKLRQKLAGVRTAKDSIAVLYDILDLSTRAESKTVGKEIYDVAMRHGVDSVVYDICRQLTAPLKKDEDFAKIQEALQKMPRTRERDESILFLKMKRMSYASKYVSEEQRQKDIARIIAEEEISPKKDVTAKIYNLYTLVEYLRNDVHTPMLHQYLQELMQLLDKRPFELYAIYNQVYSEAANIYTDVQEYDHGIKADEKLLAVTEGLEKKYERLGRKYRNYEVTKYVIYRRMLRNAGALTPEEIRDIHSKVLALAANNSDVKGDMSSSPRYYAYYYYATGDYGKAIPYIKRLIDPKQGNAVNRQLYAMLQKSAEATGDTATLIEALKGYNKLLLEYNDLNANMLYKQLQIRYEVDNLKAHNNRLEIDRRDQKIAETRRSMTLVAVGWVLVALLLGVMLYFWTRYRANQSRLSSLVDVFTKERNSLRDSLYIDNEREVKSVRQVPVSSDVKEPDRFEPRKKKLNSVEMVEFLLNDIAYISSIGRGNSMKFMNRVSVDRVMRRAVEKCRSALKVGVQFDVVYPENDMKIYVDRECLDYVLDHILRNSAEFTDRGEVKFSVRMDAARRVVRFILSDTGIPIKGQEEQMLFQHFIKVEEIMESEQPGLFICRLLSFLLHCDLKSDSNMKEGASFMLTVPVDMLHNNETGRYKPEEGGD